MKIIPTLYSGLFLVSLSAVTTTNARTAARCPEPFMYIADKCFWFFRGRESVNRKQANAECEAIDAHLALIPDALTQRELTKWINSYEYRLTSYWIGLSDANGNGEFRWLEQDGDIHFTSWGEGQPDPKPERSCVVMSHGKSHDWKSVNCTQRNLFICEKSIEPSGRASLGSATSLDQFCYDRSRGYYADPADCRNYILCFKKKIFKYTCPNNEVFDPVALLCGNEDPHEICNTEPEITTTKLPVIDVTENSNLGEPGDYYENNDYYGEEEDGPLVDYVESEEDEEVVDYDLTLFSDYVCEDPGYMKLGKRCYKIFSNPVRWIVANETCSGEEGGRLATIKSGKAQRFIVKRLKRRTYAVNDFWIGLNDQETDDTYIWSDNSVLTVKSYENWSRRARKRHRQLKKCVEIKMLYKGRWEDDICANENGYICEKDAVDPSTRGDSQTFGIEPKSVLEKGRKIRNLFCGTTRRNEMPVSMAVVGGQIADVANHPWQASLRSFGEHRCGGTLIDSCWVLTAAHCVDVRSTGQAKLPSLVVLGDVDTSVPDGTEKYVPIAKIILHSLWTAKPVPTNDIALVKLGKCVVDINPICLPGSDYGEFTTGDECKVAGWGTMDSIRPDYPSQLQEAVLPILAQDVCKNKYRIKGQTLVQDTMFCAGYLRGGTDACQGDSGGPLSCKGVKSFNRVVQWGVVSWGFGCAMRDKPGVYTKVASYMSWIRNHTMIDF